MLGEVTFNIVDGRKFNSVEAAEQLLLQNQNKEAKYFIIDGIFTENIGHLADAFNKCSPINFKANAIVIITKNKSGVTNEMSSVEFFQVSEITSSFGTPTKKDCYIRLDNYLGKIMICRVDKLIRLPQDLDEKLKNL